MEQLQLENKSMKEFVEYYENGRIKSKGFLQGSKKQGKWEFFSENNEILKEENYKDGKLHGLFKRWFENGQLAIECEYSKGKCNGKWIEYYENGNKKEEGYYQDGNYIVSNFWNDNNEKTLINGTGYKIEKYGALKMDIYKQYFKNSTFIKEEKLSSLNIISNQASDTAPDL